MKLSIIVPCYNEEKNIKPFYEEVLKVIKLKREEYELIFINDGSKDNSIDILNKLYENDKRIIVLDFSRNFGKEAGIYAGLQNANGDYLAIIDADLQQKPEYLNQMLQILETKPEYDCVAAYQGQRAEGKFMTWCKKKFYQVINQWADVELKEAASDFRVFTKRYAKAILSLPELCRFSKGIFSWVGFNTYYLEYEVAPRLNGKSKWHFGSLMRYALTGIVSFSTKPLMISSVLGIIICLIAFIYTVIVILKTVLYGEPVAGYPTLMCVLLFGIGFQLLTFGIAGLYLSNMYVEIKKRPIYILKDKKESHE